MACPAVFRWGGEAHWPGARALAPEVLVAAGSGRGAPAGHGAGRCCETPGSPRKTTSVALYGSASAADPWSDGRPAQISRPRPANRPRPGCAKPVRLALTTFLSFFPPFMFLWRCVLGLAKEFFLSQDNNRAGRALRPRLIEGPGAPCHSGSVHTAPAPQTQRCCRPATLRAHLSSPKGRGQPVRWRHGRLAQRHSRRLRARSGAGLRGPVRLLHDDHGRHDGRMMHDAPPTAADAAQRPPEH